MRVRTDIATETFRELVSLESMKHNRPIPWSIYQTHTSATGTQYEQGNVQCRILERRWVCKICDRVEIYALRYEGEVDSVTHPSRDCQKSQGLSSHCAYHKKNIFSSQLVMSTSWSTSGGVTDHSLERDGIPWIGLKVHEHLDTCHTVETIVDGHSSVQVFV